MHTTSVAVAPGLGVAQATHLSLLAMLIIIQVGHSHVSAAGLNCVNNDCGTKTTILTTQI